MIPVQNVYYLLAYAWGHLQRDALAELGAEGQPTLPDMLGLVLANGVNHLVRRGLDRDYQEEVRDIAGVRGRIDFVSSIAANSFANGRAVCRFEELRHDVLQNQILKATLLSLLRLEGLASDTVDRARLAYQRLEGVSDIQIERRHFGLVQVHRNNGAYRFLLNLCLLISDSLLVNEETGSTLFYDFRRDEAVMWRLFEQFVYNFLKREQSGYAVRGQTVVEWGSAQAAVPGQLRYLPVMKPDVLLTAADRRIALDTKFYQAPLDSRYDHPKVDAANLYQVYAYLDNLNAKPSRRPPYEGMLLYAVVDQPFSFDFTLNERLIHVRSIDLMQDWKDIHANLLAAVGQL